MKRNLISTLIMLIVVACSFVIPNPKSKEKAGFTVVELFTSQGCSSCPPADLVMDSLQDQFGENVYFLAFHVDYWNNSGWEDPYSQPLFSKYQREYNNLLEVGVYTPMMVVNGQDALVGSNRSLAIIEIEKGLKANGTQIKIECMYQEGALFVKYDPSFNIEGTRLNVAYVKKEAFTDIKSGENGGKILRYTNIVQRLKYAECDKEGISIVDFPLPPTDKNFHLIAYLQDKNTFRILGASKFEF